MTAREYLAPVQEAATAATVNDWLTRAVTEQVEDTTC